MLPRQRFKSNKSNGSIHSFLTACRWEDGLPSSCTRWQGSAAGTLCSHACRNVLCQWGTDTQSTLCTRTAWGLWRRRPPRSAPAQLQREEKQEQVNEREVNSRLHQRDHMINPVSLLVSEHDSVCKLSNHFISLRWFGREVLSRGITKRAPRLDF